MIRLAVAAAIALLALQACTCLIDAVTHHPYLTGAS